MFRHLYLAPLRRAEGEAHLRPLLNPLMTALNDKITPQTNAPDQAQPIGFG